MRRDILGRIRRALGPRQIGKSSAPLVGLVLLALAGVLGAGFLASCDNEHRLTGPGGTALSPGVPIIRVKLCQPTALAGVSVTGAYRVRCDGRVVAESMAALPACDVTTSGSLWRIGGSAFTGRELVIEPVAGNVFYLGSTCYRGSLHCIALGNGTFVTVNHVDMESYIAGVLPRELLSTWSLETYKALAVAARTFALYHKYYTGPGHDYDLGDGESSQVYGGYTAEFGTPNARRAVEATRGQVLAYRQGGSMQIFMAQYSAACGGVVNPAYIIRNAPADAPIAGGQVCNDCRNCPRYRWPDVRVRKTELYQALAARYPQTTALGNVAGLNIASTTPWGRAVWIDVIGTTGQTLRLRAEDLRLAWNMSLSGKPTASSRRLYSLNCTIRTNPDSFDFANGHGFGHGVGLCQWGAQAKAARGWTANQILGCYYPGASLLHAY